FDWTKVADDDIRQFAKKAGQFAFLAHLRTLIYRDLGGCPAPMNSFLMLQGLETLAGRMQKHCDNAALLTVMLNENDKVKSVNYPGLADSPFHDITEKLFAGRAGAVFTFNLGSKDIAFKFINSLKLAKNLANLGDVKTLVIHPASTIFREFTSEEQAKMGITDDMIRVSVGTEDIEDIKNDFEQAIEKAFEVK
ncbi:MAG TPA: O-acetylhomoserine aminocarboxypropyltransferase/cysteine synthase, partial [Phycisphaerales bacterium]|nr:O-acetylhomoserine aminocarboxypropyltransferase/cysteine synthase [Phycisphaerales bacterium]